MACDHKQRQKLSEMVGNFSKCELSGTKPAVFEMPTKSTERRKREQNRAPMEAKHRFLSVSHGKRNKHTNPPPLQGKSLVTVPWKFLGEDEQGFAQLIVPGIFRW